MVEFEDKDIISEAKRRFQEHVAQKNILPADYRSFVYRTVLSTGNSDTFEQFLSLYRATDVHEEKNRILSSLGAVQDVNKLQRILEFSMSEEVRAQDAFRAIKAVTANRQGQILAWQYFKDNWEKFVDRYQSGILLTIIVQLITENIVKEEMVKDIEEFFQKHSISGTERTVQQSLETIRLNVAWLKRDKDSIEEFLKAQ